MAYARPREEVAKVRAASGVAHLGFLDDIIDGLEPARPTWVSLAAAQHLAVGSPRSDQAALKTAVQ